MSARHLLSVDDLSDSEVMLLTQPQPRGEPYRGVRGTLAFLFQQPSVRTMSSFASAGVQAGLTPITVTATGEAPRDQCDVVDEIRQLSLTSACVVARASRPLDVGALRGISAPVVNAGDGSNEHPSQALLDTACLRQRGLEGKTVVLMGNLRDHRVHHSLVKVLQRLGVTVRLVCPRNLGMPQQYLHAPIACLETDSIREVDAVLATADYVYMSPVAYWNNPNASPGAAFTLDLERATRVLKRGAIILHPFPRLGELAHDLDGTVFDGYHAQTAMGPEIRRRLLSFLLA